MEASSGGAGTDTEFDAVLADGTLVHLRPPTHADRAGLEELLARLSRRSAYYRFFSLSERAPRRYLDLLLAPDERDLPGLVALIGDRPVAIASYERPGDEGEEADVAFLVDDEHQGLGISTLLLEALAADASHRGITRFVAEVLPENQAMLDVFKAAGFAVSPRFRDGTIRVDFPLTRTEALLNAVGERERRADALSIARLLAPASVAVVTAEADEIGNRIAANVREGGFPGPVHTLTPDSRRLAAGLPGLPDGVDLAILTLPAVDVLDAAAGCAAAGVRNLLVSSGGFSDAGPDGARLEQQLVQRARRAGMRLLGPHSLGVINTAAQVQLHATPLASRPPPGRVGVLSHSQALGVAMLGEMTRRGIGVSTFVSAGNTADVSGNDLLLYWEQDAATEVVVLYLERFGNPRKFARIARRLARSKPVVVVTGGRSAAGARATSALGDPVRHPPAAVDALFRQTGVIRLDRVAELFGVLDVLLTEPLPRGRRVAVVGNSAAAIALAADAAVASGLVVPELTAPTQQGLRSVLPPAAGVVNPVDLLEPTGAEGYLAALPVLVAAEEVDAVLISHALYPGTRRAEASAVSAAATGSSKPVVASVLGGRRPPPEARGRRVPSFPFPEAAARALATVADYAGWLQTPAGTVPHLPDIDTAAAGALLRATLEAAPDGRDLDRADAERLMREYGIAVQPPGNASLPDSIAWTIGVVQDPLFGPLVSFGGSGVASELFGDIAHHVLPLTDTDAAQLVRSLRCSPLLFGYRDAPPLASAALEALLLRVARLAEDHREVARLELDPVLVTTSDAVVGELRVHVAPAVRAPSAWLRRLR